MGVKRKAMLLEEWKETRKHVLHYHEELNKVSMWVIGILSVIFGSVINLLINEQFILSGLLLSSSFWLISYLSYIQKRNAIYYIGSIERSNELEKPLGIRLSKTLSDKYKITTKKDTPDEKIDAVIGDPDTLRRLKYVFLGVGIMLIIHGIFLIAP